MPRHINEDELIEALRDEVDTLVGDLAETIKSEKPDEVINARIGLKEWQAKLKELPSLTNLKQVQSLLRKVGTELATAAVWLHKNSTQDPLEETTIPATPEPTPITEPLKSMKPSEPIHSLETPEPKLETKPSAEVKPNVPEELTVSVETTPKSEAAPPVKLPARKKI